MSRTIALCSMSYSGSTLANGLFNWLHPAVVAVGEAHWIMDRPPDAICTACGPPCQIMYRLNRQGLDDSNLYDRIRESAGAEVLVTSDKAPVLISRFVQPKTADIVVLLKSPYALAASFQRHGNDYIPAQPMTPERWTQWYDQVMRWASCYGKSVTVLEYEQLATYPSSTFARLCAQLSLPAPPSEITFPPPNWHNIGGNAGTWDKTRYKEKSIMLDERWVDELDAAEIRNISTNDACMALWRSLQSQAV